MGPISCPKTSVGNYHYSLSDNTGEHSSYLLRGGSLKSRQSILASVFFFVGIPFRVPLGAKKPVL